MTMLLAVGTVGAQENKGRSRWSVTPHVGLNVSRLGGCADQPGILAEKTSYYPEYAVTDTLHVHDVCTFRMSDGQKADWQLMLDGWKAWQVVRETTDSEELTITFDRELVNFYAPDLKRMYDSFGRRCLRGRVCSTQDDRRDSMDVVFQLSPDPPVVKDVQLSYDYFDYDQAEFIKTGLSVTVEFSPGTSQIAVTRGYMDLEGHANTMTLFLLEKVDPESNTWTWTAPSFCFWDFDYYFLFSAFGGFGESYPDTVFVNDYLDPYYIDLFRQWQATQGMSDVAAATDIEVRTASPGEIVVMAPQPPVMMSLVDMSGRVIARSRRTGRLSYPSAFRGPAVISVQSDEGMFNFRKILP